MQNSIECKIRDHGQGNDLIRSQTEVDKDGWVIVCSLTNNTIKPGVDGEDKINRVISDALGNRRTGNSNVHDQSSRSHAIMICEIVTEELVITREAI